MSIGSLVIDIEGKKLSEEDSDIIKHPMVGGVILFSRNYESRDQLKNLCKSIDQLVKNRPILIMTDQEGGRVQRFKNEFSIIPPMAKLGELFDVDASQAIPVANDVGYLLATELLSCGVDLNLGPVLDLQNMESQVIGDRAFHQQGDVVSILAKEVIKGMTKAGMAPVGKHFPGHGSIVTDSHKAIAQDDRSLDELQQNDLIPFKSLIQYGIPALMAAHVIYPKVDDKPVSYSQTWLKGILPINLAFKGAIFSDDLSMEGANISNNYADRVAAAREAGCDFVLLSNQRKGVIQALDQLDASLYQVNESRWMPVASKNKWHKHAIPDAKWQLIRDRIERAFSLQTLIDE